MQWHGASYSLLPPDAARSYGRAIFPPQLGTLLSDDFFHSLSLSLSPLPRLSLPCTNLADSMFPSLTTNSLLHSPSAMSLHQARTASRAHSSKYHSHVASSSAMSLVIPVIKRHGDPASLESYRPISLASCAFEVFELGLRSHSSPHFSTTRLRRVPTPWLSALWIPCASATPLSRSLTSRRLFAPAGLKALWLILVSRVVSGTSSPTFSVVPCPRCVLVALSLHPGSTLALRKAEFLADTTFGPDHFLARFWTLQMVTTFGPLLVLPLLAQTAFWLFPVYAEGEGPEGWEAQNFALFSLSCHNVLSFFLSWVSFRGILVVFEARGLVVHVWSSRVVV